MNIETRCFCICRDCREKNTQSPSIHMRVSDETVEKKIYFQAFQGEIFSLGGFGGPKKDRVLFLLMFFALLSGFTAFQFFCFFGAITKGVTGSSFKSSRRRFRGGSGAGEGGYADLA